MKKFNLQPIGRAETTKDRVYSEIKSVILNGHISADEIFTEVQIAELLGTSRTPVREALRDLLKEGLIVVVPRKGMSIRRVTNSEIEQIFLLRSRIESEVIRKLTAELTPTQLATLGELCEQQRLAMLDNDELRFIGLDQSFHLVLAKFARYELMEQILLNLHNLSQLIGLQAIKRHGRMAEVLEEHLSILEQMRLLDAESASKRMDEHLARTRQSLSQ